MIKVVLADDEPLAREGAVMLLANEPDMELVATCANGKETVAAIEKHQPDLVLLDIHMPGMTGFDVIRSIGAENMPRTIFFTAHDRYALDAFKVHAFDYLLKPVNAERFSQSMERVRQLRSIKSADSANSTMVPRHQFEALLKQMEASKPSTRLMIRSSGHVFFLSPEEIYWVEAEGDYVNVHAVDKSHLIRDTMQSMQNRLKPHGFQRAHRSSLINLQQVLELVTDKNGEYFVLLKNGTRLKLSRSYREALYARMTAGD